MAEELAKADYKNHGFTIMDTGIGSDFKVIKKSENTTYEEYVEVKSGNARLSRRQSRTKNILKREGENYSVYRVSDKYLKNCMSDLGLNNFNGIFLIRDFAFCPHCRISVNGIIPILQYFGLRNMENGIVKVQSWCIKCRSISGKPESYTSSLSGSIEYHKLNKRSLGKE